MIHSRLPGESPDRWSVPSLGGRAPRVLVWYEGAGEAAYRICERVAIWLGRDLPAGNIGLATTAGADFDERARARGNRVYAYGGPAGRRAKGAVLAHLPANWRRFGRLLDEFRPDVVILAMNFAPAWPLLRQIGRRGIRLVYVPHDPQPHSGDFARSWQVFSQNRVLAAADMIVPMSAAMLTAARGLGGDFARLPAEVVPLHTLGVPRVAQGRVPAPGQPLKFLFFGRLIAYKGFDLLAEACRLLAGRDDWTLTIAGDGPMKADVPVLFAGLERQVNLDQLRHLDEAEIDALVASHDVLVCPYRDATQSAVIAEAILEGVPSIVTPAGALPEQVDFGAAGYVASAMTGAALAEAMTRALDDRDGVAKMSSAALGFWHRTATGNPWRTVVEKVLALPGRTATGTPAGGAGRSTSLLHDLWRLLPHRLRRRVFETAVRSSTPPAGPVLEWPTEQVPIIVAGVLQAPTGLGEAARGAIDALRAMGRDVRLFDLTDAFRQERVVPLPDLPPPEPGPGILLVFANPPTSSFALATIDRKLSDGKLKIGSWVWEYARVPQRWAQHAAPFHILSAPTELVRGAVGVVTGLPVARLPYHVPANAASQAAFRDSKTLRIGFIGDIVAAAGRKNPMAVVEAVGRAFAGRRDIEFEMILRGASDSHPLVGQLCDRARHFGLRLSVDARLLDTAEHHARLQAMDVFCSLHRAEGFGLTIAEAMAAGLPVVATQCPAVAEYLDDSVGYPVPYRPVTADPLVDDPTPGLWAEPDIDAAVAALRAIDANRTEAALLGTRAMQRIEALYSARATTAALDAITADFRARRFSRP